MRKDIDYEDVIGEGIIYDEDWLTPSLAKGKYRYHKLDLSSTIAVYYRLEGSHYTRFEIVLSFDYLGAHAPRSLPILFYGFVNMLDIWEKLGAEAVDLDWNEENEFWNTYRLSDGTLLKVKIVLKGVKRLKQCQPDEIPLYTNITDLTVRTLQVPDKLKAKPKPSNMQPV